MEGIGEGVEGVSFDGEGCGHAPHTSFSLILCCVLFVACTVLKVL